jgi:mono/diheme cytochrome c family protein
MLLGKADLVVILSTAALAATGAIAQESRSEPKDAYSGSSLFRTYCSSCHGLAGKGDGPIADRLRVRPPDLTLIARRDRGKWDADKVARIIDGRDPVKGHGGADMPVWGDAFKSSREGYDEESVKARVRALVEHLEGIQERGEAPRN